mmetsp:Transcript_803/g.1669  ORF Transcript_803/g.1669 Transcript_803/m.1669 type:complete len:187 (+) Transcript_803:46-606(+)
MPPSAAQLAEQYQKIKDCLDSIDYGEAQSANPPGTTSSVEREAIRKSAILRLQDYVEGDNTLLLTAGRDYLVVPILAGSLVQSRDPECQLALLRLLGEFVPSVKKKQIVILCTDESLSHLLSLLDTSAFNVADQLSLHYYVGTLTPSASWCKSIAHRCRSNSSSGSPYQLCCLHSNTMRSFVPGQP